MFIELTMYYGKESIFICVDVIGVLIPKITYTIIQLKNIPMGTAESTIKVCESVADILDTICEGSE